MENPDVLRFDEYSRFYKGIATQLVTSTLGVSQDWKSNDVCDRERVRSFLGSSVNARDSSKATRSSSRPI